MTICRAIVWVLFGVFLSCGMVPGGPEAAPLMESVRQLVVVRTADWHAFTGALQRYERASASDQWHNVGAPIPVVIGRNGLSWGIGLHDVPENAEPLLKLEGDGKAPAGAFTLGPAFGYDEARSVSWIRLPYIKSDATLKCIDDVGSRYYNTLVSEGNVAKDWKSSEDMLLKTEVYRFGTVIQHNWSLQTVRGRGSCIFFHIWEGPDIGTSGCTAMKSADLKQLLGWLDPHMNPVLLQIPESEVRRFSDIWQLPQIRQTD